MTLPFATRPTFIGFAQRDCGLTAAQAAWEFDNVLTANGHAVLRDFYLHTSRVGAPFAMNRAERRSLFMSFENAQGHAYFDAA
jgi:hypothetical protein